jgi:hypothetical protein
MSNTAEDVAKHTFDLLCSITTFSESFYNREEVEKLIRALADIPSDPYIN